MTFGSASTGKAVGIMLRHLLSGIQFLTIVPCGRTSTFDAGRTTPFFPVVGLAIGLLLATIDYAAAFFWERSAIAVIDVLVLVLISGALHLDGLADTADGLYGQRAPDRALEIMKDSRIGSIGMVAVTCCLAVKWAGLNGLQSDRFFWLLLVPAFARASILFGTRLLPYGRPNGTGHPFFQRPLRLVDFWGVLLLFLLALLLTGWHAALAIAAFALLMAAVLVYYRLKINCITGDMLGAMVEICEAGLFLFLSAIRGAT